MNSSPLDRRAFFKLSLGTAGAIGAGEFPGAAATLAAAANTAGPVPAARAYNGTYEGARLNHVAFPLGGIGAGMICIEGTGALSHFSLRNKPDLFNEPCVFSAIAVKGDKTVARVIEGPVPSRKVFGGRGAGNGLGQTSFGLPRFQSARFRARFPFAEVTLADGPDLPLDVHLTAWSPFVPGRDDDASVPVAALEYRFSNRSGAAIDCVYSFNARNFLGPRARGAARPTPASETIAAIQGGFVFTGRSEPDKEETEASFAAMVDDPEVKVNHAWFRGGWFDPLTMAWRDAATAACYDRPPVPDGAPAPGASLFVPFRLAAGESRTLVLRFAWHSGHSDLRLGRNAAGGADSSTYQPWYAKKFADVQAVAAYWTKQYADLRRQTQRFTECFYDSTLPPEVVEAVAANLTILKSPTVLRQGDGRFWAWEGCNDDAGCCHGSCTHVWNYAQALPHLFPALERTLRETEFEISQDATGNQAFRASLPIRAVPAGLAAADGQLGGVMKVHREWRISGDSAWLRRLWPKVRASLDYCINKWDPQRKGWIEEPHHNTYDIEFWGADGMCTSFYLGALRAAEVMGRALGEDVGGYAELLAKGVARMEAELFDGEFFAQRIEWKTLQAKDPTAVETLVRGAYAAPEARELLGREGPKYQYGQGCLSDGVLGAWMALVCGVGEFLSPEKVASHLRAVHRYNLKRDLSNHPNPQRPSYAVGAEGGLLLCTWPKGGELSLPFVYSNEVWTGIEYQVASHLMLMGCVEEGLEIVRMCRDRYDGARRNPFDEYECGHWYARAMSSYALLQALSGARYDAVEKVLHLTPSIRGDFRCFLAAATGYGTVGLANGKPFLDVKAGTIDVQRIHYVPRV